MTSRVDLLAADECPECGDVEGFEEGPAGYYTCLGCWATWAGDVEAAELVEEGSP